MKTTLNDFHFIFSGNGYYYVTYESPATGKRWKMLTNDMTLIDKTKNVNSPKQKDLEMLKFLVKNTRAINILIK